MSNVKAIKAKKDAIKLTDYTKNDENPFMSQAIELIDRNIVKRYQTSSNTDKKATLMAFDPNTSEVLGYTRFVRQIEVDESQFAKLYLANFAAFFDLSQASIRVFGYILTCLKPKNDMFMFDRKKCMEYTKYTSDRSVYKGLAELIAGEIIARGPNEYVWFINPMIVFNGDRVTFAKTYVKKKTKAIDDRQLSLFPEI